MSGLAFGSELPIVEVVALEGPLPVARITFQPEPAWITVELPAAKSQPYGMLSGAEGQGSELAFMEDGSLGDMILELRPPEIVEVVSGAFVEAVRNALADRMRARVKLVTWKRSPLVPDLVALSPPLDLALFSFCGWMELGREPWREELDELELVEIARGVTLGLSRRGGAVAWAAVEGFAERQKVLAFELDARLHDGAAVAALTELHRAYYRFPSPAEFDDASARLRRRLPGHVCADAEFMAAFERVVHSHLSELRLRDAESSGSR